MMDFTVKIQMSSARSVVVKVPAYVLICGWTPEMTVSDEIINTDMTVSDQNINTDILNCCITDRVESCAGDCDVH